MYLPKPQKVGEVANAPEKIAQINDECFSYLSGAHANDDSFVSAVHSKPTTHRLVRTKEYEAVRESGEESIKTTGAKTYSYQPWSNTTVLPLLHLLTNSKACEIDTSGV